MPPLFLLLLFTDCVSGADSEMMSVMEGDSLTLHTNLTEIQDDDTILWMFGQKDLVISQISRKNDFTSFFVTDEAEFRDRLQLDQKTGSLTIRNTRIRHSGQYKLTVSREQTTTKTFSVTVFDTVGETGGVKSLSVMEGHSVTLHTDTEIHTDDLIVWRFGDKGILLVKMDVETREISLHDDDERFKDQLQLDQQGSLTIKNTRPEHAGLYELQIRGRESSQQVLLSVAAVSEWTLSSGEIAVTVVAVLLVAAVLASVVIYYRQKIAGLNPVKKLSVMPGMNITLQNDDKIQDGDLMLWTFGDKKDLIVKYISGSPECIGERFKHRLETEHLPKSLTINNMDSTDSGQYKLQIINGKKITVQRFIVTVPIRTVSVRPGKPVTLQTDASIRDDDLMLWTFGDEKHIIVKVDSKNAPGEITGERFKDRLDLDEWKRTEKRNLTIKNMETTDSGQYKLQIINCEKTIIRKFEVSVHNSAEEKENVPLMSDERNEEQGNSDRAFYE